MFIGFSWPRFCLPMINGAEVDPKHARTPDRAGLVDKSTTPSNNGAKFIDAATEGKKISLCVHKMHLSHRRLGL